MRSMTEGLSCGHCRTDRKTVRAQTFGLLLWGRSFAGSALHPQGTSSPDPFSAFRTPLGKIHPYTRFACSKRKRLPSKRGEGPQIAPEPGSFGEGSVHRST